jgi:hypothetical protein
MKFTPARGLFRLVIVTAVVLVCVPVADFFMLGVMGILFCILWLVCWLIGGFFDME